MTTDLRSALERARDLAPASPPGLEALATARSRRERRRRVGAMTLSLLVGLLVIAGAFAAVRSQPGAAGPAAGGGDFPTPAGLAMPPGSYLYRHEVTFGGSGLETSSSSWWAGDGSGRLVQPFLGDATYGPGELPTDSGALDGLSLDATELRAQMRQRMSPDGASPEPYDQFTPGPGQPDHETAGLIRSIGELLGDPNTTPELRAALFRVAAGLDGVSVTRGMDPVGRSAIELQVTTEQSLHHWWFDPNTQQLLAMQDDGAAIVVIEAEAFTPGTTPAHVIADLIPAPVHDPR